MKDPSSALMCANVDSILGDLGGLTGGGVLEVHASVTSVGGLSLTDMSNQFT